MFEALTARAARTAERRADAHKSRFTQRLEASLPGDMGVEAGAEGVRLSGRALKRRLALDPALRWIMAELIR